MRFNFLFLFIAGHLHVEVWHEEGGMGVYIQLLLGSFPCPSGQSGTLAPPSPCDVGGWSAPTFPDWRPLSMCGGGGGVSPPACWALLTPEGEGGECGILIGPKGTALFSL